MCIRRLNKKQCEDFCSTCLRLYLPSFFVRYYSAEEIQVRCFSPHMIELCFPGNRRPGDYVKISTNLREWHVFPVVEQKYKATDDYSRNIVSNLSKGSIASRFQLVSDAQGPSYYVVHIGGHGKSTVLLICSTTFEINMGRKKNDNKDFAANYTHFLLFLTEIGWHTLKMLFTLTFLCDQ